MTPADRERGSAVAEFVLVLLVLIPLVAGLVQVALLLHLRNVIGASATEAARAYANAGVTVDAGGNRARELVARATSTRLADGLSYAARVLPGASGAPLVEVTVDGRLPLAVSWLPGGPHVHARGHVLREPPP